MTKQVLPEGLVARYEHVRRVLLVAEVHPDALTGPVPVFTEPLWMNRHEWSKCREQGFEAHVLPEGGKTICCLYRPSGVEGEPDTLIANGETRCSLGDNYVKSLGRIKALGRALKSLR